MLPKELDEKNKISMIESISSYFISLLVLQIMTIND